MNPGAIIMAGFFLIVLVGWTIGTYNKFIKYRNRIEESLNNIDVALKRRANLIPGLIKVIKGYSDHEDRIFQARTESLSTISDPKRLHQEQEISRGLGGLLALAEAYPDLKASSNFLALQESLMQIEKDIQQARNRYNAYVSRFNTLVESFPANLMARKFGFRKMDYITLELATQREMPEISFQK